jgi:catechol 2,3-dioxygenase-like lactoylglutathione lyase family enzyme
MDPHLHVVTLGVPDLAAARRFYVDGLGWKPTMDLPGEITFIQINHGLLLGLWEAAELQADADPSGRLQLAGGTPPISLGHNVATETEVAAVLDRAQAAGGTIVRPAQKADFGGTNGYFADPAGFLWDVVYNPNFTVAADGTVSLSPPTE